MIARLRRFALRLYHACRPGAGEPDLSREVDAHLRLLQDEYERRGLTPEQAALAARRAFGGVLRAKDLHREARSFAWVDDARRDVRYAVRALARTPGFTAVVVLTLALGIGATAAIFSVLYPVLIHPLPFSNADRLVHLYENVPASESSVGKARRISGMDVRELIELRSRSRALSHVIGQGFALVSIAGGVDAVQRELTSMSAAAFPMLGVPPMLGRWLVPEDERPGGDKVIVLSYDAWQRYFAGDSHVLGRVMTFNGNTFSTGVALGVGYTVVGIMPPDFHFPDDGTQFWTPLALTPPASGRSPRVGMMARLADGVTLEAAAAEVSAIVQGLRSTSHGPIGRSPGLPRFELVRVQDEIGAPVRPALLVLAVTVGLVLLIACANVANLLLARTAARQREIAVRVAIGAGRGRLIRQLLTESVLLSAIGGAAGMLLAAGGVRLFRLLASDMARIDLGSFGNSFPRLDAITINGPVLGFTAVISVGTGILFGLVPAIRQAHTARLDVLRVAMGSSAGSSAGRRSFRTRDFLVVAEIAMATLLFVGGGLLVRSFLELVRVDAGYDPSHVLTFQVGLPGSQRPAAELETFAEDLTARLRSVPGVQAASYARQLPMVDLRDSLPLRIESSPGGPAASSGSESPDVRLVGRDYLKVMGIHLVEGRALGDHDGAGQPRVLLVNRTLARDFPGRSPVGATVYLGYDSAVPWEVIGVVDDVRQAGLDRAPRPQLFVNLEQSSGLAVPAFPIGAYYAVRTSAASSVLIAHAHDIVREMEPRASVENVATMDQIVSNSLVRPRLYAVLLGIFAGVAVFLAAAGIFGVMAFAVVQRTREIGIRMALGAQRAQVLRLVLGHAGALTIAGLLLGLAGAIATTRYLEAMLFGLTPLDATTFATVAVLFSLVAATAAYLPARRATRIDPLVALRCE